MQVVGALGWWQKVLLASTLSIFVAISSSHQAHAITTLLPDPGDMSAGTATYIEVSRPGNGNLLNAPETWVKIYSRSPNGRILIYHADVCSGSGVDTNDDAPTLFELFNSQIITSTLGSSNVQKEWPLGPPLGSYTSQRHFSSSSAPCGWRQINFAGLNASTVDGHAGWYVGYLRAYHFGAANGVNAFKVAVDSPNLVGYWDQGVQADDPGPPGTAFAFAIQDRVNGNGTRSNFNFEFAPPCEMTTDTTVYLRWQDADWGTLQFNNNYRTVLTEYDSVGNISNQQIILPRGGNDAYEQVSFTARPFHRYTWNWENVVKTNGVQIWLPFDSFDGDPAHGSCTAPPPPGTIGCGGGPAHFQLLDNSVDKAEYGLHGGRTKVQFNLPPGNTLSAGRYKVYAKAGDDHFLYRRTWASPPFGSYSYLDTQRFGPIPPGRVNGISPVWGDHNQRTEQFYVHFDMSDAGQSLTPRPTPDYGFVGPYSDADVPRDFNDLYDYVGSGYDVHGNPLNLSTYPGAYKQVQLNYGGEIVDVVMYADDDLDWPTSGPFPDHVNQDRGVYLGEIDLYNSVTSFWVRHIGDVNPAAFLGSPTMSTQPVSIYIECTGSTPPPSFVYQPTLSPAGGVTHLYPGDTFPVHIDVENIGDPGTVGDPISQLRLYVSSVSTPGLIAPAGPEDLTGPGVPHGPANSYGVNSTFYTVPPSAPGGTVCFRATVTPFQGPVGGGSGTSPDSNEICFTIEPQNQPYARYYGSDVFAGGIFADHATDPFLCTAAHPLAGGLPEIRGTINGNFGSATEIAAYALGNILNFGTQGGGIDDDLKFGNQPPTNGNFGSGPICMTNYYDLLANNSANQIISGGTFNLNSASDNTQYHRSGDLNLVVPAAPGWRMDKRVTIVVDGDVTISRNIPYDDTFSSINDIPAFLVVARGNIRINDSVTQLDGVYIAIPGNPASPSQVNSLNGQITGGSGGVIHTCANVGDIPRISQCSSPLRINGKLFGHKVVFHRTANTVFDAGPHDASYATTTASEFLVETPEVYLGNFVFESDTVLPGQNGDLNIQSYKSLPPVF